MDTSTESQGHAEYKQTWTMVCAFSNLPAGLSFVSMRGSNDAQVLCRAHLQVFWKLLKCGAILESTSQFRDGWQVP